MLPPMSPNDARIEASGLAKSFGRVAALRDISLEVPCGTVGLLGPNGAGKTTLLKVLLGLLRPDRGMARVAGFDPMRRRDRIQIRTRIGYMPEGDCLLPDMTGVELVATLGRLTGLSAEDAMSRAHEALDYCQVEENRYRPIGGYSTGMKQRLKLAQALVHDPEILLLDEPTNGLDPLGRRQMLDVIADLGRNQGKTVLLCTHLLPDVEKTASHVIVIQAGTVCLQGAVADLTRADGLRLEIRADQPTRLQAALRERGIAVQELPNGRLEATLENGSASADPLFHLARAAGVRIEEVKPVRSTLEQVFLKAIGEGSAA